MFFQTITSSLSSLLQTFKQVTTFSRDCKTNREMEKCKTKSHSGIFRHIHAYSDTFRHISKIYPNIIRHIQAYSGIIQANSKPCVTLAYSELWYIQNPAIFKTRGIFRTLVYPKLWHIQNLRHTQNPELLKTLEYSQYSQPETYSKLRQTCTMEHLEKQLTAVIFFASYNYFRNVSLVLYFTK